MDDYAPSPAARLIEASRATSGLSVREAARRAGLSEGRWRQIAKGYQAVAGGTRVPVNAPLDTLVRMARAVGVTTSDLAGAGARDVAKALHDREAAEHGPYDLSGVPDEVLVRELLGRLLDGRALRDLIG